MTLAVVSGSPLSALPSAPVDINEGGTGETVAAAALAALGGLDSAAHAALNHAGVLGVPAPESFTAGVHAGTSHSGIAGIYGGVVWFSTDVIVPGTQLRPFGDGTNLVAFRAPKAGTITTAVFAGNTSSVDYLINGVFNTGFVTDGQVLSPGLAVTQGQLITVSLNTIGTGTVAAWSLLIE